MDYDAFYDQLFHPLETRIGQIDPESIVAVVGFDAGGPLNFCTIGKTPNADFVTYVSCELAVRNDQRPADCGRYELLTSCNDEQWVRSNITALGLRRGRDPSYSRCGTGRGVVRHGRQDARRRNVAQPTQWRHVAAVRSAR